MDGEIGNAVTALATPLLEACIAILFQTVVFAFVVWALVLAALAYAVGVLLDRGARPGG